MPNLWDSDSHVLSFFSARAVRSIYTLAAAGCLHQLKFTPKMTHHHPVKSIKTMSSQLNASFCTPSQRQIHKRGGASAFNARTSEWPVQLVMVDTGLKIPYGKTAQKRLQTPPTPHSALNARPPVRSPKHLPDFLQLPCCGNARLSPSRMF